LEFAVETAVATKHPGRPRSFGRTTALGTLVVLLAAGASAGIYWKDRWQSPAAVASGNLRVESDPSGADVRVNGASRGTTPLSLTMPVGTYTLAVQRGTSVKELPVAVANGAVTVHHITWADVQPAAPPETGSLSVATDPAGGLVSLDGNERGAAPVTLRNLSPGQHRVVVRAGSATYTRTVQIEAGSTASLIIGGAAGATSGWLSIASPIAIHVYEGRQLIGTSEMDRIMVPGGEHEIELASDALGFRSTRRVRVVAGQTTTVALELPSAPLSINAVPWAEVFIDGTRAGETPLGNLPQTIGPHDVVFRHPQLGERRLTAVVRMNDANRVSMDMRSR
jgi:hypothetical protein